MEADKLVIMKSGLVKLIVSITRIGAGTAVNEEDEEEDEDEVGGLEATRLLTGSGWSICG